MKTIAEILVMMFFDDSPPDGQEWPDGLEEALETQAVRPPYHPIRDTTNVPSNSLIYEMLDGSCIVESGGAWDYGYPGTTCGCWASQPHHCGLEEV